MVREIPLTKGYVALVDDEDYDALARWGEFARINFPTTEESHHD